jgi:hypothetical protein
MKGFMSKESFIDAGSCGCLACAESERHTLAAPIEQTKHAVNPIVNDDIDLYSSSDPRWFPSAAQ